MGAVDRDEDNAVPSGRATKASAKIAKDSSVPVSGVDIGEHELGEHEHRGDGVDEEIEVLGRAADDDADRDVARR